MDASMDLHQRLSRLMDCSLQMFVTCETLKCLALPRAIGLLDSTQLSTAQYSSPWFIIRSRAMANSNMNIAVPAIDGEHNEKTSRQHSLAIPEMDPQQLSAEVAIGISQAPKYLQGWRLHVATTASALPHN